MVFTYSFLVDPLESETETHSIVSNCLWPHVLYSPWNSIGQNTGLGSLSLLQGIFPTQGSNPRLLHCRWIVYQLSHKGSPRMLEWAAHLSSRGVFPTQESKPGLLHCRRTLYQLSHKARVTQWCLKRGTLLRIQWFIIVFLTSLEKY